MSYLVSQGREGHVRPAGNVSRMTLKRKPESLPLAPSSTINLASESPEAAPAAGESSGQVRKTWLLLMRC